MISLFSGTPGSGKSLHTANLIYWRLRRGKNVLGNFNINTSNIKNCKGDYFLIDNEELTPQLLRIYSDAYFYNRNFKEDEILLVIDESQIMFNSRSWNAKGRDDWIKFLSNHRKYGYYIILVAQFDKMLDRQIRSLLEYEHIHRKVSNFGLQGKAISLVSGGNLFVSVKIWYPLKEKVSSEYFKAHKRYYSIYDSYNRFDTV